MESNAIRICNVINHRKTHYGSLVPKERANGWVRDCKPKLRQEKTRCTHIIAKRRPPPIHKLRCRCTGNLLCSRSSYTTSAHVAARRGRLRREGGDVWHPIHQHDHVLNPAEGLEAPRPLVMVPRDVHRLREDDVLRLLNKLRQDAELVGRVEAELGRRRTGEIVDCPWVGSLVVSGVLHVHVLVGFFVYDDLLFLLLLLLLLLLKQTVTSIRHDRLRQLLCYATSPSGLHPRFRRD